MLVDEAVERIKRDFIDEYDVLIENSDIYQWIYEAELDVIRRTGTNEVNTDTTVGAFPSAVPTSVSIKRISINGVALKLIAREELDMNSISDTVAAVPQFWYMVNNTVHLWPQMVPSSTAVRITYSKVPILMTGLPATNTFTVPQSFHTDIMNYVLSRAFSKSGETAKMQEYMELYDNNVGIRASEAQTPDTIIYKGNDPQDFMSEYEVW